jgi:cellulose synthase/poly-beta-1,6-N-acetylglucosamine synthase-like glycosyltransferase
LQIVLIIFFSAIAIQLVYLILFLIAFQKKNNKQESKSPPVSIIVCAHDELENLKELIPLLQQQQYSEFEIIIVDDRSNDSTFDFLLEETKKDHRLRMVHVNRLPAHVNAKKYAITLGIKAAKFEWVVFTDADCRPGDQWISSMSSCFSNETSFVLGFSPYLRTPGVLNAFIRFETIITAIQYISFTLLGNPYMGVGRNLAYRRSVFLDSKGFNNFLNVTGGDDDLLVNQHATATNTVVQIEAASLVYSKPKVTWSTFFNQKVRHLSVGKYYKFGHRLLLGLFSISWVLIWLLGVPLAIASTAFYWVLGALFLRALVFGITLSLASKQLSQRFEVWAILPLDFIYAFYYLVTGLVALVSKKIRWKN